MQVDIRASWIALSLVAGTAVATAPPVDADPRGQSGALLHDPVIEVGGTRFASWPEYTQSEVFRELGLRCGAPGHDPVKFSTFMESPSDCSYGSTNPTEAYAPSVIYDIPVVVHVLQNESGKGFVSEALVRSQIEILNEDFRALSGTPGGPGVDTRIQFHLATVDPDGNPTSGVAYTTNTDWFKDSGNYWGPLHWDTERYMNVYTNKASGALGYVPDIPQGGVAGKNSDRVVVLWSAFGRNAPIGAPFNQGRTLTHEVGHYLGLYHTFDGGCGNATACYTTGDRICDTNRQSSPSSGCGSPSSCSSPDPVNNYMDYSNDVCMFEFSEEQARRMRCSLEFYRPFLSGSCAGEASATGRSAGANPDSYAIGAPVIGTTIQASVDLSGTGHSLAGLFAYAQPTSVDLGGGSTLLVDAGSAGGELLRLPLKSGPVATYDIAIPPVGSLCGLAIYTQAVHVDPALPMVLSNAQDLILGF